MFILCELTFPWRQPDFNDDILDSFIRMFDMAYRGIENSRFEMEKKKENEEGIWSNVNSSRNFINVARNFIWIFAEKIEEELSEKRKSRNLLKYYRFLWKVAVKGMRIYVRSNPGKEMPSFFLGMDIMDRKYPKCGIRAFCKSRNIVNRLEKARREYSRVYEKFIYDYVSYTTAQLRNDVNFKSAEKLLSNYKEMNKNGDGGKWWKVLENIVAIKECNYVKCQRKDVKLRICARCLAVYYCERKCQKKDWKMHKKDCFAILRNFEGE